MVNVYPNPAGENCTLTYSSDEKRNTVLSLYDQSGQLLQQKRVSFQPGENSVQWDLSYYAAGVYLFTDDTGTIQAEVIKQ